MIGEYLVVGIVVTVVMVPTVVITASMVMAALHLVGLYNPPKYFDEYHRFHTTRYNLIEIGAISWIVVAFVAFVGGVGFVTVELVGWLA